MKYAQRTLVATAVGGATGSFCWYLLSYFHQNAADFQWAVWGAQDLLHGINPYLRPLQLYPLPAMLIGLPFVTVPPPVAGGLFYGISSALLAFGIMRHGWRGLLIFLAYPYWAGMLTAQWSPIILASGFLPVLLPVTLAKPQLGLSVLVTRAHKSGLVLTASLLLACFIILPKWPWLWFSHFHSYVRFIPLMVIPGPLLLLAIWRYRDPDAVFLLLAAISPQRWFYDQLILWLIPRSRREFVWTVALSWIPGVWRWYHLPQSVTEVGRMAVLFMYFPMLCVILLRDPTLKEKLHAYWATVASFGSRGSGSDSSGRATETSSNTKKTSRTQVIQYSFPYQNSTAR
jgi:hypothetical protein